MEKRKMKNTISWHRPTLSGRWRKYWLDRSDMHVQVGKSKEWQSNHLARTDKKLDWLVFLAIFSPIEILQVQLAERGEPIYYVLAECKLHCGTNIRHILWILRGFKQTYESLDNFNALPRRYHHLMYIDPSFSNAETLLNALFTTFETAAYAANVVTHSIVVSCNQCEIKRYSHTQWTHDFWP